MGYNLDSLEKYRGRIRDDAVARALASHLGFEPGQSALLFLLRESISAFYSLHKNEHFQVLTELDKRPLCGYAVMCAFSKHFELPRKPVNLKNNGVALGIFQRLSYFYEC